VDIIEVFERFPDKTACIKYLEEVRWSNKPSCPYCGSSNYSEMKGEHRYHCNSCNTSFSVTVGTIFHNTKLPLQKWFVAVSFVINARKCIAARQLSRAIHVTKDTAWRMLIQIRVAMAEYGDFLHGIIEADEIFKVEKTRTDITMIKRKMVKEEA